MSHNEYLKNEKYDALILGAGPSGSTLAILLARAGKRVLVVEKSEFPRFHIGESLLPATIALMKELGIEGYLCETAVKKPGGVWIYGYTKSGKEITTGGNFNGCSRQASFYEAPHSYMVQRDSFDKKLAEQAKSQGAEVLFRHKATKVLGDMDEVIGLEIQDITSKTKTNCFADMVYDCTGISAYLGRKFKLRKENDLKRMAVFGHFDYKPVHPRLKEGYFLGHVIPKGWTWYIPLGKNKLSVGVVGPASNVKKAKASPKEFLLEQLGKIENFDRVMESDFELIGDVRMMSNFGATSDQIYGKGWALVGDAAFFVDPCFSSGVHLSMMHAQKLADLHIAHGNDTESFYRALESLSNYMYEYIDSVKTSVDTFYMGAYSPLANFLSPHLFFGPTRRMFVSVLGGDFDKHRLFMKFANRFTRFLLSFEKHILRVRLD